MRGDVYKAAARDDRSEVQRLLRDQRCTYYVLGDPAPPLTVAIQNGHYALAEGLLNGDQWKKIVGVYISSVEDKSGNTSLFEAAKAGQDRLVELILQLKGATQVANAQGFTPLYVAAQHGHLAVVERLLAHSGRNLAPCHDGTTALWIAAKNGHLAVVEALISHSSGILSRSPGIDLNLANTQGETALFQAVQNKHVDVVRCLANKGAKLLASRGRTPLWLAARDGRSDMVEILLAVRGAGSFINTIDEETQTTALAIAVQNGHLAVVQRLLAERNHVFSGDQHPLWLAVKHGHQSVLRYLCTDDYPQKGELLAEINTRFTRRGLTPFYQAVSEGRGYIAKCLLDEGARYLAATDQTTPLWAAAKNGHLLLVQHLLGDVGQWGIQDQVVAVLDIPSQTGATALYMAAEHGHEQIVARLLEAGAKSVAMTDETTPLWVAANSGHVKIVDALLEKGVPYLPCKDGTTPLQAALRAGHRDVVDLFLKQENPEILAEIRRYTPHMAGRDSVMLARLLELGVNVNGLNHENKSAMTCALERSDFAAVALLLIYGAGISREEAALIAKNKTAVTDEICKIARASQLLEFKRKVLNLIERIGVCPNGAVVVDPLLRDHAFFKPRSFLGIAPRVDNPKSEVSKLKELYGQIKSALEQRLPAENPQGLFAAGAAPAASFGVVQPGFGD